MTEESDLSEGDVDRVARAWSTQFGADDRSNGLVLEGSIERSDLIEPLEEATEFEDLGAAAGYDLDLLVDANEGDTPRLGLETDAVGDILGELSIRESGDLLVVETSTTAEQITDTQEGVRSRGDSGGPFEQKFSWAVLPALKSAYGGASGYWDAFVDSDL